MAESKDEDSDSKPIYTIYANCSPTTIAIRHIFSAQMKRPTRPVFSLLVLIVVAATLGYRVAIRSGFGSIYGDGNVEIRFWGSGSDETEPISPLMLNSTLLELAETEAGEAQLRQEIGQLLKGDFGSTAKLRTFATWHRFFNGSDIQTRVDRGMPVSLRSSAFQSVWLEFRRALGDWARNKRFQPDIMDELIDLVKVPIDKHHGLSPQKKKYSSCAVVGNSGILLTKEFEDLIDSHEAVIRLNNARIESYKKNVGSKTSISFMNSNILHLCARREDCFCHPYGANVPIVMYMCQPAQFLDYVACSSSHKSPLTVTDPRFDVLCARIVKYYSLKRFLDGPNKTLEQWYSAHDGPMFHYSSGMQAVMLALGICDRVSLFGFGKSTSAKHHYHTNQKAELGLHDYEAEYDLYRDLVERPQAIPFISREFKFPPVLIHR